MAAAPQWAEVAKGVLAIAQVVAIVGAAAWGYFRFVRGRTFAERLEASVNAAPFKVRNGTALRLRATVTNTGAAKVNFDEEFTVICVYGATVDHLTPGVSVDWGPGLALGDIFTAHKGIEAQETVSDEVLVTVPSKPALAYRTELIVASKKKKKKWSATAIVPAPDVQGGEDMEPPQEPLTPEEEERIRQLREEQKQRDEEARKEAEKKKRRERVEPDQTDS